MKNIFNNSNNYKYLHYFQKILIGTEHYPFITQYMYIISSDCTNIYQHIGEPIHNIVNIHEPNLNINDFTVIDSFFDVTRPKTTAFKMFSILCEHNKIQYIVNFVKKPLFYNNTYCTARELKLLNTICTENMGLYVKDNETPYFMEIHKLNCIITDKQNIQKCSTQYSDLLYDFILSKKYDGSIIEETKQNFLLNTFETPLDTEQIPIFAMLLYK